MTKEKTVRTVIRVPESIHACMQEQAREAGYDDGRGPGLAKYLISLHVAHVDELGRCYADLIADAFPKPAEAVPDVVTFEGMTGDEQWWFLDEVANVSQDPDKRMTAARLAAVLVDAVEAGDWMDVDALYDGGHAAPVPGYCKRYDVTLAYVEGVMNGQ
jgi:hypothetical protein